MSREILSVEFLQSNGFSLERIHVGTYWVKIHTRKVWYIVSQDLNNAYKIDTGWMLSLTHEQLVSIISNIKTSN